MSSTASRRDLLLGAAAALVTAPPVFATPQSVEFRGMKILGVRPPSPAAKPQQAPRRPTRRSERRLRMDNLHIEEVIDIVYWVNGSYDREALAAISHFMRDWRNGQVKTIDPKLINWLYRTQQVLDSPHPLRLISGYRSEATNRRLRRQSRGVAANSWHTHGRAADIRVHGHSVHQIRAAAQAAGQEGGIGRYSRSDFVHMDTGRVRNWGA